MAGLRGAMRATKAIVRRSALTHNLERARALAPAGRVMAVIKANAYGHGAIEVARTLAPEVDAFAVAILEEAIELRKAGVESPVLILEGVEGDHDLHEALARNCWLMMHRESSVKRLCETRLEEKATVWLKYDTGMHRLGMDRAATVKAVERLAAQPQVQGAPVLCTHLACADDQESRTTPGQVFAARELAKKHRLPLSAANSAGVLFGRIATRIGTVPVICCSATVLPGTLIPRRLACNPPCDWFQRLWPCVISGLANPSVMGSDGRPGVLP